MSDTQSAPEDELVEQVSQTIHNLLIIKGRLPILEESIRQIDIVVRDIGDAKNLAVYQLLRDSYDMLVIDLASLREGMVERRGLLNKLRSHVTRFRRFTKEDCDPVPTVWGGGEPTPAEEAAFDDGLRAEMAAAWNRTLDRIFPDGTPVAERHVDALVRRFMKDTEPIMDDRNHVRAHRYEESSRDGRKYQLPVEKVAEHMKVFESYLNDLYLVLAKGTYSMEPIVEGHPERTGSDLADIIVYGSINDAVNAYEVVPQPQDGEPPWYYHRREKFYERRDGLAEAPKP